MSQPEASTPLAAATETAEAALCLLGAALLVWLLFSDKGRQARRTSLAPWGLPPLDFACYALAGIAGALALSVLAGLVLKPFRLGSDGSTVVGSAMMEGGFILGLWVFHREYAKRAGIAQAIPALGHSLRTGAATFLVAMPFVFLASSGWEALLVRLGLPDEKQQLVGILENSRSPALIASFIAVAVVIVPVAEELVFRAGIFRYFRTRFPRWFALAFSSALFAAPHVDWSHGMAGLPSLAPLAVLALIFCLAYEVTGSIGTTIVAHALFNLNMILLVFAGVGS